MSVVIVDCGMGNISSVRRTVEECGLPAIVSQCPDDLDAASHVILPGVGSFSEGARQLISAGWTDSLTNAVIDDGLPMLGICLGMQLLASHGTEHGSSRGLDFIPGKVEGLVPRNPTDRISHIGWNEVELAGDSKLFDGILSGTDFYFVHGFHFVPENQEVIIGTTPYCGGFVSAVCLNNIFGVQFHPEKSSNAGRRLIRNFLEF